VGIAEMRGLGVIYFEAFIFSVLPCGPTAYTFADHALVNRFRPSRDLDGERPECTIVSEQEIARCTLRPQ
jgi:hypothetical protein